MDRQSILKLTQDIYEALNTLEIKGYNNCKTYSNCMDALNRLFSELNETLPDNKNENSMEDKNV